MATNIGKLAVILGLNSQKFNSGLGKASKKTTQFKQKTTDLAGGLKTLRGAFAAVAGAAGIGMIINRLNRVSQEMIKVVNTADKLGIAVERMAGLELAARSAGIGVDKMGMAMQRMVRRVSEAASGTGEAKAALKELGLDAKQLNLLGPEKQLMAVADAMKGLSGQTERIRLGFKVFDAEGVDMIRMLQHGAEGLKRFHREAELLGSVLSREAADRVLTMGSAFEKLGDAAKGAGQSLVDDFAAPVTIALGKILDLWTRVRKVSLPAKIPAWVAAFYPGLGAVSQVTGLGALTRALPEGEITKALRGDLARAGTGGPDTQSVEARMRRALDAFYRKTSENLKPIGNQLHPSQTPITGAASQIATTVPINTQFRKIQKVRDETTHNLLQKLLELGRNPDLIVGSI